MHNKVISRYSEHSFQSIARINGSACLLNQFVIVYTSNIHGINKYQLHTIYTTCTRHIRVHHMHIYTLYSLGQITKYRSV